MIAAAERVALRIEERQHALTLIVVQQEAPRDVRDRNEQADDREDVAQLQAREQDHHAAGGSDQQRRAEVRLLGDQQRRHADADAERSAATVKLGGSGRSCRNHAHASGTASFMISEG